MFISFNIFFTNLKFSVEFKFNFISSFSFPFKFIKFEITLIKVCSLISGIFGISVNSFPLKQFAYFEYLSDSNKVL